MAGCQDCPLRFIFGWPAREGPHPSEELGEGEGFGKVVVSTSIQALDAVFDLGAGCEHQNRDANVRCPEPFDDLDPVEVGQHPVDHQQVEILAQGSSESRAAVGSRVGDVALTAEDLGQEIRKVLLVLHDQYPHHYRLKQSYPSAMCGVPFL